MKQLLMTWFASTTGAKFQLEVVVHSTNIDTKRLKSMHSIKSKFLRQFDCFVMIFTIFIHKTNPPFLSEPLETQ